MLIYSLGRVVSDTLLKIKLSNQKKNVKLPEKAVIALLQLKGKKNGKIQIRLND